MMYKRTVLVMFLLMRVFVSFMYTFAYAEDTTTTEEATPTPVATIDPEAQDENALPVEEESIAEQTTDEPSESVTNNNNAEVNGETEASSTTGDNTETTTIDETVIETGSASASVDVVNNINENVTGSEISVSEHNVLEDHEGTIDLTQPPAPCNISTDSATLHSDVSNTNNAVIANDITITASTGNNSASATEAAILTGDADIDIDVINVANTNITGDCAHYGVVNVMNEQHGDIILPYEGNYVNSNSAASSEVINTNNVELETNIEAKAETGENSAQIIQTGDSTITVRQIDSVNTNISGNNWIIVRVNGTDLWTGDFVGWNSNITRGDNYALAWTEIPFEQGQVSSSVTNTNTSVVANNIRATADTGNNAATGANSSVRTGDAHIDVDILNILNTNITGSSWYYEIINIFDTFVGNIVFPRPDVQVNVGSNTLSTHTGDEASYTVSYANSGTLWADDVVVEVQLPLGAELRSMSSGGTFSNGVIRWNQGLLKAGGGGTVSFVMKLEAGPTNNRWRTQATVHTSTQESNQSNNMAESFITNILPTSSSTQTQPIVIVTVQPSVTPFINAPVSKAQQSVLAAKDIPSTMDKKGIVSSTYQDKTTQRSRAQLAGIVVSLAGFMFIIYKLRRGVELPFIK